MNPIKIIAENTFKRIETMNKYRGVNQYEGIETGYKTLDVASHGLKPGEVILVAGRPSIGKTVLAMNLINNLAVNNKSKVLYFLLDISEDALMTQFLSLISDVPLEQVENPEFLDDENLNKLKEAADIMSESKLMIDDRRGLYVDDIYDTSRHVKAVGGLDLIIIDYLQLLCTVCDKGDINSFEAQKKTVMKIKQTATELEVPIIVLSQISRQCDCRKDGRPLFSDFKNKPFPNLFDSVWFLYRDEYYNENTEEPGIMEINIAKQTYGARSTVKLRFDKETGLLSDM